MACTRVGPAWVAALPADVPVYVAYEANYGLFSLAGSVFPPGKFVSSYPLRAYVARSDDGGATFGQPVAVSKDPKDHASRAYPAVGKDGAVYVFAGEVQTPDPFGSTNPPAAPRIFLSTSTDGGKTFTQTVIHTSAAGKSGEAFAMLLAISAAVDTKTGDLYLTWEDTGRQPPAILFSRSSDNGATWSEPVKVNDAEPGRQWQFDEEEPMVSVAPSGRIDSKAQDVYFTRVRLGAAPPLGAASSSATTGTKVAWALAVRPAPLPSPGERGRVRQPRSGKACTSPSDAPPLPIAGRRTSRPDPARGRREPPPQRPAPPRSFEQAAVRGA